MPDPDMDHAFAARLSDIGGEKRETGWDRNRAKGMEMPKGCLKLVLEQLQRWKALVLEAEPSRSGDAEYSTETNRRP